MQPTLEDMRRITQRAETRENNRLQKEKADSTKRRAAQIEFERREILPKIIQDINDAASAAALNRQYQAEYHHNGIPEPEILDEIEAHFRDHGFFFRSVSARGETHYENAELIPGFASTDFTISWSKNKAVE